MRCKSIVTFIVSCIIFIFAASHRFHDSAHAIGTIKKGGGKARHPALLDSDRNSYVLIATAGVVPPYRGNARVVLEGNPTLKATFHNSGPAVDLGIHRHPDFKDNTFYDLRPKDKVALWVKIKRNLTVPVRQATTGAETAVPPCSRCDTKSGGEETKQPEIKTPAPSRRSSSHPDRETEKAESGKKNYAERGKGRGDWQGRDTGENSATSPALAFYDTVTNERLLSIPIRFTGGTEGGDNAN